MKKKKQFDKNQEPTYIRYRSRQISRHPKSPNSGADEYHGEANKLFL